jgi:hypothetical protein
MARVVTLFVLLAGPLSGASALAAAEIPAADVDWNTCVTYDVETGEPRIDPARFFDVLIEHYRSLKIYEDTAQVTQVMQRAGEEPTELQTQIGCEIEEGRLHVQTPASQLARGIGLELECRKTEAMKAAGLRYDIWLAPHMALRFADEPKRQFREGVEDGFVATDAETIIIDARPMLLLELRSGEGGDEDCEARFDLYVNPQSLLIERIEGTQRLPDGGNYQTTLEITPLAAEIEAAKAEPEPQPEPAPAAGAAPGGPMSAPGSKTAGRVDDLTWST